MLFRHIFGLLVGINLILTVICQSRGYFNRNCPVNRSNDVRECKMYVDTRLNFIDFRQWTSGLGNAVKVSLDITCSSNGRVYIPWPMKANGLVKLTIEGCTLEGYASEFNTPTRLKDELQDLSLDNIVIVSNLDSIFDIIYKPVTPEYDCGQQTLRSAVRRNISYMFPNINDQRLSKRHEALLMSSADELIKKSKQKRYRCNYSELNYIDQSLSRTRSKLYLRLMTAYSEYPELQTFLIADNGYRRVPQELIDWRKSFPQLTLLDMSKNKISKFDFLGAPFKRMNTRSQPLVADLSNNLVTTIPLNMPDYLTGSVPIIVDLTGNPLNCNCDFLRYKNYAMEAIRRFGRYNHLSQITCYSPRSGRKISLANYRNNNCLT